MQDYIQRIKGLNDPSFIKIKKIAEKSISDLSKQHKDLLWTQLGRGEAILTTHEQMCRYLSAYGDMHQAKLSDVFCRIPDAVFTDKYEVIDWGCGQGMGVINLFDHLKAKNIGSKVSKVTLIEPSLHAIERAALHVQSYLPSKQFVYNVNSFFDCVSPEQIQGEAGVPVIHIFSNILDIKDVNLKQLANLIDKSIISDNYIVCVGPLNFNNKRIDAFYRYFNVPVIYEKEDSCFTDRGWTYKGKLYKLGAKKQGNLTPIVFYPSIRFHAAFELDSYKIARKQYKENFFESLCSFEVATPFDIGASVYDNIHPIFAVLNNIITRGLPTRASLFIEEVFHDIFHNTIKEEELGEIFYKPTKKVDLFELNRKINEFRENTSLFSCDNLVPFQELLTPIAIARFQKVIVEAIITGHLSLEKERWEILVEERDVPFAALALKDFTEMYHHLTQLSEDYSGLNLPEIYLDVISPAIFRDSLLHLTANVSTIPESFHFSKTYDLVLDLAMLAGSNITQDTFNKFKCLNDCYFYVRSTTNISKFRTIYTTELIRYKKLVQKNVQGVYVENLANKNNLIYFLQLIFRKNSFRPGQLPILDRATQNLPVIGLLPTGGGKSLTYQLAALLQPGVTLIVDPLKSLMKDQYDGLIKNGIDCCTYINSSVLKTDRENRQYKMESAQLLFVFVSPERLAILDFRNRLRQMHESKVYFSYAVIDEVHCISEWGHDFRVAYLHLGRNLYNFVKSKDGHISLFGLTATASFDVLADVERELSGNGIFDLDSDVVVRYENTSRLELQYRIEAVEVEFQNDFTYDTGRLLDSTLPKAIEVGSRLSDDSFHLSKSNYINDYLKSIPTLIEELQTPLSIEKIKRRFLERQNNEDNLNNDLLTTMQKDFYQPQLEYESAGIVFCPHAKNTELAVDRNSKRISKMSSAVGSYASGKSNDSDLDEAIELFRNNKLQLMVATSAFGMGIDKPNVRFTVNMNYPSSLESFVQEAGRAGRDRKMALATILMSNYEVVKIRKTYPNQSFPLQIIKDKWFRKNDFNRVIEHYKLNIPPDFIDTVTPDKDLVKLYCKKNKTMFDFNICDTTCSEFGMCKIRKVPVELRDWISESQLISELERIDLKIGKKYFQYFSADYKVVMFFFNENFKGDVKEKEIVHELLYLSDIYVSFPNIENRNSDFQKRIKYKGLLSNFANFPADTETVISIPFNDSNKTDIAKAIYRMCCIEFIIDLTEDKSKDEFRVIVSKKQEGGYYSALKNFLLRYYTIDRVNVEFSRAIEYDIEDISPLNIINEINKCLTYLTDFVYDKISEKRKRAIDDIRNFCIEGADASKPWLERNESLKDYIYYYFNSKYAKADFTLDNGEPYSLTKDTENGKKSDSSIVIKYLKVIDEEFIGSSTPNDNVKHLQGAVRLLKRSLTDSNPTLSLLNAFTLVYLGTKNNKNLESELLNSYKQGMVDIAERMDFSNDFWKLFISFNKKIEVYLFGPELKLMIDEVKLSIHNVRLNNIVEKYTGIYE